MVVCKSGDAGLQKQMEQIYNDTYDYILKYVVRKCKNPSDIHDIVQNIYIKFYDKLVKGVTIEEPRRYLTQIAKNEVIDHYRVWGRESKLIPVFSKDEEENFNDIEKELSVTFDDPAPEILDELWQYLQSRDPLTFKIFVLHFHYDMKIDDVANSLEVTPSMVKNRLYRTIKEVREKYNI